MKNKNNNIDNELTKKLTNIINLPNNDDLFGESSVDDITENNLEKEKINKKKEKEGSTRLERLSILDNDVNEINKRISDIISKFSIDILTAQLELFTFRQVLVEKLNSISKILIHINSELRVKKYEAQNTAKTKTQYVTKNYTENETIINYNINEVLTYKEKLDIHKSFLENSLKTIDNMLFGINSKIKYMSEFSI